MTPEPAMIVHVGERLDSSWAALLIVDMQCDFCEPHGAAARAGRDVSRARSVISSIGRLLTGARASGVLVCHIGLWTLPDHGSDSGPWLAQRRRSTFSSESMCIAETPGADFVPELAPTAGEPVIHKHRYSGFKGTDLDLLLKARGIRTCVVAGVSTNVCVESTARDAFELDYYVIVPRDATASWSDDLADASLQTLDHRFGIVTDVGAVLRCWTGVGTETV